MEAILKFTLPEDRCAFAIASTAMDWALTVSDIDKFMRDKLKYGFEYKTPAEALEDVRKALHEELSSRNLTLEMIE